MESTSVEEFWNCICILLKNYHAINKKIFGCVITKVQNIEKGISTVRENWKWDTQGEPIDCMKDCGDVVSIQGTEAELEHYLCQTNYSKRPLEGFLINIKFLTKKDTDNILGIVIIDLTNCYYTCNFLSDKLDDFTVQLNEHKLVVKTLTEKLGKDTATRFLEYILKPKLLKWCQNTTNKCQQQITSLQLIDLEAYNHLYNELKHKYSKLALQFWESAQESTDPLKFIYEDICIASYLITLWRQPGISSPMSFADLGCGNGLLVYLLRSEGFQGYGYDLRKRKLWLYYPEDIRLFLIEQAIDPDNFSLPPEVDWLIGNHSDELSPWLPVLASQAKYNMKYFVLPCCAYEFSGEKFQRRKAGVSVYQDFIQYVDEISNRCGFITMKDRLKIPSTKRIALMGIKRKYDEMQYARNREEIEIYVKKKCTTQVKIREKYEVVRNCTQLDKSVIVNLIKKIFMFLLNVQNKEQNKKEDQINFLKDWRPGGQLSLAEIALKLTKDDLQHIKSECGGIKTLLRNKHEIFEFCGNNMIGIRRPRLRQKGTTKPETIKKRECFFKHNHPDGCLLSDAECTFVH